MYTKHLQYDSFQDFFQKNIHKEYTYCEPKEKEIKLIDVYNGRDITIFRKYFLLDIITKRMFTFHMQEETCIRNICKRRFLFFTNQNALQIL